MIFVNRRTNEQQWPTLCMFVSVDVMWRSYTCVLPWHCPSFGCTHTWLPPLAVWSSGPSPLQSASQLPPGTRKMQFKLRYLKLHELSFRTLSSQYLRCWETRSRQITGHRQNDQSHKTQITNSINIIKQTSFLLQVVFSSTSRRSLAYL